MSTTYYSSGPWGDNTYFTTDNTILTQVLSLSSTNPAGDAATLCKMWFMGNGVGPYLVQRAYLQQGTGEIVPVLMNGASIFYVPKDGCFSDYSSTAPFTLPGDVNFIAYVKGNVPGEIISGRSGIDTARNFELKFEGTNGDITWDEEGQPLALVYVDGHGSSSRAYAINCSIDTSEHYVGASSLRFLPGGAAMYHAPRFGYYCNLPNNFRITTYFKFNYSDLCNFSFNPIYVNYLTQERYLYTTIYSNEGGGTTYVSVYTDHTMNHVACPISKDTWHKVEVVVFDRMIFVRIDDVTVITVLNTTANPTPLYTGVADISSWVINTINDPEYPSKKYWIDSIKLEALPSLDYTSVTSTGTIEVSDNSLIEAGDTITISGATVGTNTYTFATTPTGASNQIVIGPDASTTAQNIAAVINATYGAMFTATSADEGVTVTVTAYTSDDITITDSSDGITTDGGALKSIVYNTSEAAATLPSFTAQGYSSEWGNVGANAMISSFAPMTASGTAESSGNVADVYLPAFTATGQSFLEPLTSTSSAADMVALLMFGNSWMESFAAMVAVPGDSDDVALVCTQYVAANITWTSDLIAWGVADYWISPRQTLYLGVGDCEDQAFLVASLIINSGVDYSRVRVYLGETLGVGHAWVEYCRSDNQWVILDATKGSAYWNTISDVNDLDEHYPILYNQWDMGEGIGDVTDSWAYGSAWAYVDAHQRVDLSGDMYLESIEAMTSTTMQGSIGVTSIEAHFGAQADITVPALDLTASSHGDTGGVLTKTLPALTLSANCCGENSITVNVSLPAITISASGEGEPSSSLAKSLPALRLTANCFSDSFSSLDTSIPPISLSASCYEIASTIARLTLPGITLHSEIRVTDIIALALNTKNFGLSKYTNYDYNSMCVFNGKVIGAKRDGIYELSGSEDDNTSIPWKVRTPKINLGKNKLRDIRISGKISGDILVIAETSEGDRYEYSGVPVSETEDVIKVKVGKGLCGGKGVHDSYGYITLEIQNEGNEIIAIDKIEGFGIK